jgi:hypothetical protein
MVQLAAITRPEYGPVSERCLGFSRVLFDLSLRGTKMECQLYIFSRIFLGSANSISRSDQKAALSRHPKHDRAL